MTRTLTAGMTTAVAAQAGTIVYFVELAFSGATVRYTTAPMDVSWNSQIWSAVGGALVPDQFSETADLSAAGGELTVSGVDSAVLSHLLNEQYIGRSAKVWLGHIDSNGAVVTDPLLQFSGFMNGGWEATEDRNDDGQPGTVTVKMVLKSRLSLLEQRRGIQANMGSHHQLYNGDRFFQLTGQTSTVPVIWKK